MKRNHWIIAGLVGASAMLGACSKEARIEDDMGVGGSGPDIGQNEGVLNDGEGPIEERTGGEVWNDGEGPIEERTDDDAVFGDNPGVINDGEGPIEDAEDENIGDNPGILDDGEGPLENNEPENQ